ncbi:ABC-three component system middle component 6, partial [Methylovulum psychrotolerans]
MIMPTKIIQPVDSLIVIGSCVLKLLAEHGQLSVDDLLDKVNKTYHKPISIDKL